MQTKQIRLTFLTPEQSLSIAQGDIILHALTSAGVSIKHACSNGVCGVCLTPLLDGEIDYEHRHPHGLNEKEKQNGYFLPCIATCKTDIAIAQPKVLVKPK